MFKTFRLGRLLGFPIEVNLTFLLMLGAVLLWMGGLVGVFVVLVAFASVLLHELGHSIVARRLGVRVSGIELHFFGGAAKMIDAPKSARDEIYIALAGPAVSVVLAGIGWGAYALLGSSFFYLFGTINSVIAIFNLLPALPMDGGRVLRAALTYFHSYRRATELSVTIARGLTIALGVLALATGHIMLGLLAVVLWMMGSAELRGARYGGYRGEARPVAPQQVSLIDAIMGGMDPRDAPGNTPGSFRIRRIGNQFVIERVEP